MQILYTQRPAHRAGVLRFDPGAAGAGLDDLALDGHLCRFEVRAGAARSAAIVQAGTWAEQQPAAGAARASGEQVWAASGAWRVWWRARVLAGAGAVSLK